MSKIMGHGWASLSCMFHTQVKAAVDTNPSPNSLKKRQLACLLSEGAASEGSGWSAGHLASQPLASWYCQMPAASPWIFSKSVIMAGTPCFMPFGASQLKKKIVPVVLSPQWFTLINLKATHKLNDQQECVHFIHLDYYQKLTVCLSSYTHAHIFPEF